MSKVFKPISAFLIGVLLVIAIFAGWRPTQQASAQSSTPLRTLASARNFMIGAAANPGILQNNAPYANIVKTEFNVVTPGNAMKMDALQPTEGTFSYADADSLVNFAMTNNMKVHGHVFVWHSQYPGWLNSKTKNRATFLPIMENHIMNVAQHFGTNVYAWDVVNEAIEDNGTLRSSIWSQAIGSDFIDQAFLYARQYTPPGTVLIYNDYNVETINVKSNYMYTMVQSMKARNIPIDAVGLQMHIHVWDAPTYEEVRSNIARFAALGVKVYITEMDVALGTTYPALPTAAQLDQQKQIYAYVTKACLDTPGCDYLTAWGVTDGDSWLNGFLGDYQHPMLFDRNYAKKPAYFGVQEQLASISATNTPLPPTATLAASANALRIDAGSPSNYTDTSGNLWRADIGFTPVSAAYNQSISVVTNDDPQIYRTSRENMSDYNIPVVNGSYSVRLHFAETSPNQFGPINGPGKRVFNVSVESSVLNNLDIYGQTNGKNVAIVKVFNVTVSDGMLNIHFSPTSPTTGAPIIQGIEILPGGPMATTTPRPTLTPTMTATPIPPGGNLLINSGFENGTNSNWGCLGSSCSTFATNGTVRSGNFAGYVTNRSNTWMGPTQDIQYLNLLTNGGSYTASAWVRAASTPLNLQLVIKYTDSAGDHYTGLGSFASVTSSGWTQLSGNFNLSWAAGTLTAVVPFVQSNESGTFADFYIDDAFFGLVAGSPTNTPVPATFTPTITPGGPTLTPSLTPTRTLTPTITNTPAPGLQLRLQGAGTDNTQQSAFNVQLANTGVAGLSNISWRFYFTPDNGNAPSSYVLEKYHDQSGAATVSGPVLACDNIYYFTVNYGTASLAAGSTWVYNSAFHLNSFASTYSGANDWWHTGYAVGALPTAFTNHSYLPGYLNGALAWGNEPNCGGGTPTNTPVTPVVTNTPTRTPTLTASPTCPCLPNTSTPTPTIGVTNTPTRTRTSTSGPSPTRTRTPTTGPSATRTNTQAVTSTPTPTSGLPTLTPTRTLTSTAGPSATLTRTPTATTPVGACSPVTSTITVPFTFDGAGTFCWQAASLGSNVNSWNTNSVTINGVSFTNVFVASSSYPAPIGGFYYVGYNSSVAWAHLEVR